MPMDLQVADKLEEEYVHQVYRQIASHFNHSRYKPWPRVKQFLNSLPHGSLVADIGCGDGKYSSVNDSIIMIGCDICPELINVAKDKHNEVILADNLLLPFKDDAFDGVLSVAVIHHMCTSERRLQALTEMCRVAKPDALIIICVWAMEQTHRNFISQDVLVPWHLHLQPSFCKTQSTDSQFDLNERNSKLIVKVDKLTTADRVIGGSVGIEPITKSSTIESKSILSSIQNHVGRGLEKLWSISPIMNRKNRKRSSTCENKEQLRPLPPLPPPVPNNQSYLVNGLVKFSPRLGRRVANYMGYAYDDIDLIRGYAKQLATRIINEAIIEACDNTKNKDEAAHSYGPTYYRYYHVFKEGELDNLISQVPQLQLIDSFYDHANWCVIARKVQPISSL